MSPPRDSDKTYARDIMDVSLGRVIPHGTTRHGVVIGIDEYADARLNLRYAVTDAKALFNLMVDDDCGCFARENVRLVPDAEATTEGVFRALANLRRQVGEDDMVWIYYAGHAAVQGDQAYWVTHDTDVDDLFATALSRDRINSVLSQLRAKRVLLILDCCHAEATALQKNPRRQVVAAKDLFDHFEGQGIITLAASDGKQRSVELAEFGHGAFTYFLEKGLRGEADLDSDGVVTSDELWSYLRGRVTEASGRVGNAQTPMLIGAMTHDMALTLNASVTANKQRLMNEIGRFVGLRADQLTTNQGMLCLEIIQYGPRSPAERSFLDAIDELVAGTLTVAQFRRVLPILSGPVASLTKSNVASIAPSAPVPESGASVTDANKRAKIGDGIAMIFGIGVVVALVLLGRYLVLLAWHAL